jgi:hypothetical protein
MKNKSKQAKLKYNGTQTALPQMITYAAKHHKTLIIKWKLSQG